MEDIFVLFLGLIALMAGSVLGYYARQSIARKQADTLEVQLQKRINESKAKSQSILERAKERANKIIEVAKKEEDQRREELLKTERFLRKKDASLEEKNQLLSGKEGELRIKIQELREVKETIGALKGEAEEKLEKISGLSKQQAREELFKALEKTYEQDILEKTRRLEREGQTFYQEKAKEVLATAIQRCALSQAQETTSTTVSLPNEEIKGRIIGKEGRNIRTLENLTGTEIVIDDTPEIAVISGFNPLRRQIARIALENLIRDGRIQPARIEEEVKRAESEVASQVKKAGDQAIFETGVLGLDPKLIQILGRLNFRTSYGQNVLQHSMEVAFLASALAAEIGADSQLCKKAGLLHDVGKALDHQVEGSHVDIGIKILEKFKESQEVISAMKAHHGDYEPQSIEAVLVQVADQISGARPGARRDTLENYLKRLENLEKIAMDFEGVEKSYAIQAGRELRVFVQPEKVDDLKAQNMAREIASKIQEELKYPGEIKVTLIREKRVVEYAK